MRPLGQFFGLFGQFFGYCAIALYLLRTLVVVCAIYVYWSVGFCGSNGFLRGNRYGGVVVLEVF